MLELLNEILEGILASAIDEHARVRITHEGANARYLILNVEGATVFEKYLSDGETLCMPRTWRLLVQPVDRVMLHPLHAIPNLWSTQ